MQPSSSRDETNGISPAAVLLGAYELDDNGNGRCCGVAALALLAAAHTRAAIERHPHGGAVFERKAIFRVLAQCDVLLAGVAALLSGDHPFTPQ